MASVGGRADQHGVRRRQGQHRARRDRRSRRHHRRLRRPAGRDVQLAVPGPDRDRRACSAGASSRTGSAPATSRSTWPARWTCSCPGWPATWAAALYMLLPRGLPPLLVGLRVLRGRAAARRRCPTCSRAVSIPLAVAISYACRFAVNLAAFWLLDVRGTLTLYVVASNVLSGLIVPVAWFPGWMGALAARDPVPVDAAGAGRRAVRAGARLGRGRRCSPCRPPGWPSTAAARPRACWPGPPASWWCRVADLLRDLPAYRVLLGSRLAVADRLPHQLRARPARPARRSRCSSSARSTWSSTTCDALGGLDFGAALLVFALANVSWSIADTVVGHLDTLPAVHPHRHARRHAAAPAAGAGPAGHQRPVAAPAGPDGDGRGRAGRRPAARGRRLDAGQASSCWRITPVTGAAIFAALFVGAAGAQFWLVDGAEMTNAFTYGSSYVSSYPTSVLHVGGPGVLHLRRAGRVRRYLPALALTGQAGPAGLPALAGLVHPGRRRRWPGRAALLWWRVGLRHYTGAGG